jgi:CPA2 family monovalent cation:H+ antiporter-2
MHGSLPLIATLAVGLGLALLFGLLAQRLRLPPLVGYLLAGMLIGPHTPGFVADVGGGPQLAEIGVMLLMFGVGLHFSLATCWRCAAHRRARRGGADGGGHRRWGAAGRTWWGWAAGGRAGVRAVALSVASTVVLLRALEARGALDTGPAASRWAGWWSRTWRWCWCWCCCRRWRRCWGHPAGGSRTRLLDGALLLKTCWRWAASCAADAVVGRRVLPWLLWQVARTGSRELFTLA